MKIARKTFPFPRAITSNKKANDAANIVPNPRFNPLHKVAPIKLNVVQFKYILYDYIYN